MSEYASIDILLVEDDPSDAELTKHALLQARIANRIEWLQDGAAALDFLRSLGKFAGRGPQRPRLILLDLNLRGMNGIEVLRVLKGDPATRTIPVVMLTSSDAEIDMIESYGLGANSYIVKPISFDRFTEEVSRLGAYWLLVNQPPVPA